MSLFRKYFRPINFYARDRAFYARHAAGPLSSRDIMEIEYGSFPPKGWTVKDKPHQHDPVEIFTPVTDKKNGIIGKLISSVLTLGYVHASPIRHINIVDSQPAKKHKTENGLALNKLIFSPIGQAGVAYLAAMLTMRFAPIIATMNPVTILANAPLIVLIGALTSLRNQPLTQLFTLPFRPAMDTIGHENIHVLQNRDPFETRTGYNIFRNSFRARALKNISEQGGFSKLRYLFNSTMSIGTVGYFMHDYEIQARMNTLLTHNYKRWGRLPETKHELWAALIDAGLRAPRAIHDALVQSPEDVSDFYKPSLTTTFNRAAKQLVAPHIAEMNTAYWALQNAANKDDYWQRTLPYIYGHLTELCGDERGLLKMGFSGPVLDESGPVPVAAWERENFWATLKDDLIDAQNIKLVEAQRGLWFTDSTDDDELRRVFDQVGKTARRLIAQSPRDTTIIDRHAPNGP